MKYNVWDKKTRKRAGVFSAFAIDKFGSEYIVGIIEEYDYPKCPEADGWFIVQQGSNGIPIVRRRLAGEWCYADGKQVNVSSDNYTILREIDPL